MTGATASYSTWHTDPSREVAMSTGHAPYWRHYIETVPETDLSTCTVMDFGCNRGGFLRLLHAMRPFRRGVGVDIAVESVNAAREATGDLPLHFEATTDLSPWAGGIDRAFSYEVIYLLPDLAGHAAQMFRALRPGGVYYAVTGCHTESPVWHRSSAIIKANSNAPVQDYAPSDYIDAFIAAGFQTTVRRFGFNGFVSAHNYCNYYESILDLLRYGAEDKLLFRLEKLD